MNRLILIWVASATIGCGLTVDYDPGDGGDAAVGDAASGDSALDMDAAQIDAAVGDGGSDSGTDAVTCADEDGDGIDSCSDCDDSNPDVYPGAPLVCGDGVINDCPGGTGDESTCGGMGTYVSQATGLDSNPGTRAMPVQTVHQGINNATAIGAGVDVYVAEGTYREAIMMQESHSVLCGYEAAAWTRDYDAYVSDITSITNGGIVFDASTTRETMIEGCTLRGRGGVTSSVVIGFNAGSDGVARENVVYGGDNGGGGSTGIIIYAEAPAMTATRPDNTSGTPLVEGNTVYMGRGANGWGNSRQSAGISSWQTRAEIFDNDVFLTDFVTIQRGIESLNGLPGTFIRGNRIRGTGTTDLALALRIIGGSADVTHNDVYPGVCQQACVAAELGGALESVTLSNNIFIGGPSASDRSAGLWFDFERPPPSRLEVLVHSNFLAGGRTGSPSVGAGWWNPPMGSPIRVGRLINNVIHAGGGGRAFALFESDASIDPVRLEHNALYAPSWGVGGGGALYYDEGGTVLSTIALVNGLPESVGVSLYDDCSLVDPLPDGDHHLGAGSLCRDAGSTTDLPRVDFENEMRPRGAGPDIGPDEAG